MQVIFHIDINAFYASAHVLENPSLKGKPVGVSSKRRGAVITTASYEARAFGVESAMPVAYAKRLCPDLEIVEINFQLYDRLSKEFINIIKEFSPYVEVASIDECYVEVSKIISNYHRPLDLAVDIQNTVYKRLKLPISIGVAPNKFLAKMASDMKKPLGITILRIREVKEKLWPLKIEEMHGIGKKTVKKLHEENIFYIKDLALSNESKIKHILGNQSQSFIDKANGIDRSPLNLQNITKSIGQSKTYSPALYDMEEIRSAIQKESLSMVQRLRKVEMMARTLHFSIRTESGFSATRSMTFDDFMDDYDDIYERIMMLYDEFEEESYINFISVSASNLQTKANVIEQLTIFDNPDEMSTKDIINGLNSHLNKTIFKTPRDLIDNE